MGHCQHVAVVIIITCAPFVFIVDRLACNGARVVSLTTFNEGDIKEVCYILVPQMRNTSEHISFERAAHQAETVGRHSYWFLVGKRQDVNNGLSYDVLSGCMYVSCQRDARTTVAYVLIPHMFVFP